MDWFHAWATKKQMDEEINLLYTDRCVTWRGFKFTSRLWDAASKKGDLSSSTKAYAPQKSDMFHRMVLDVQVSIMSTHHQHTTAIQELNEETNDGLTKVYQLTQAGSQPADHRLDYSLVSKHLAPSTQSHG